MNTDFEDRLAEAILRHTQNLLGDSNLPTPSRLAAALIANGDVADPVAHQDDLQAIAARQDREATAWRDEYCTHGVGHDGNEEPALAWTTDHPEWEREVPVYHRRVTDWKEIHRAQ